EGEEEEEEEAGATLDGDTEAHGPGGRARDGAVTSTDAPEHGAVVHRALWSKATDAASHPAGGALLLFLAFFATRKDVWGMLTRLPAETFEGVSIFARALLFPRQSVTLGLLLAFAA